MKFRAFKCSDMVNAHLSAVLWGIRSWRATCCPWEIDILANFVERCLWCLWLSGFLFVLIYLLCSSGIVFSYTRFSFEVISSPPPDPELTNTRANTYCRSKTHLVYMSWLFVNQWVDQSIFGAFCMGTNGRSLPEINQYGRLGSAVTWVSCNTISLTN